MSQDITNISKIIATAAANIFKVAYLRALAKTTLDWDFAQRKGAVPSVSLYSWLKQPQEICMSLVPITYNESPPMDTLVVCTLVRMTAPHAVFEFGTFTGLTTLCMAMNTGADTHIWTLDLPPSIRQDLESGRGIDDTVINSLWRNSPFSDRITQVYADSRALDTAPYAQKMNFIFVDAGHEYEFVVNDSKKAFEMLAPGGMIVWHDYARGCPGVQQCLDELAQSKSLYHLEGTQLVVYRDGQS